MLHISVRRFKIYLFTYVHTSNLYRLGAPEAKCTVCNEIMVIAKDVINCSGCLKQFQQISQNPYMKTRLDVGWGLPLVSMSASIMSSPNA